MTGERGERGERHEICESLLFAQPPENVKAGLRRAESRLNTNESMHQSITSRHQDRGIEAWGASRHEVFSLLLDSSRLIRFESV